MTVYPTSPNTASPCWSEPLEAIWQMLPPAPVGWVNQPRLAGTFSGGFILEQVLPGFAVVGAFPDARRIG